MRESMNLRQVGILGHPLRPITAGITEQVAVSLAPFAAQVWSRTAWEAEDIAPLIAGSDLVIAIGGDGAMLRAARLCCKDNVPVLGINAGHVGFLTEVSPNDWPDALQLLVSGQYWIETRMMVNCEVQRDSRIIHTDDALNDIVISRGAQTRSILLDLYIDGGWATTVNADGVIISTPTGSTAYGLAVGGPILPPELKNILVVPVAAHLSFYRPLVLSEGSTVDVIVAPETQSDVTLSVDGERMLMLEPNDIVAVQSSSYQSRFIRLREKNYFYRSILDRMEPRMPQRREAPQLLRVLRANDGSKMRR
jgi:NAD+ kinase